MQIDKSLDALLHMSCSRTYRFWRCNSKARREPLTVFLTNYQQITTLIQCLNMLQYTIHLKIREEEWLLMVMAANQRRLQQ